MTENVSWHDVFRVLRAAIQFEDINNIRTKYVFHFAKMSFDHNQTADFVSMDFSTDSFIFHSVHGFENMIHLDFSTLYIFRFEHVSNTYREHVSTCRAIWLECNRALPAFIEEKFGQVVFAKDWFYVSGHKLEKNENIY